MLVKKLVIPCAGYGTRSMPASKATPKELFPLADKPVLLHQLIEAVKSGITDVLIITSETKKKIIKGFLKPNKKVEDGMRRSGIDYLLDEYHEVLEKIKFTFIVQKKMLGTANAVGLAKTWAKNEPFAVIFGDDLYDQYDGKYALGHMLNYYNSLKGNEVLVGGKEVPMCDVSRYGIMDINKQISDCVFMFDNILEKPRVEDVKKPIAGLGRYILPGNIFDYIKALKPSPKGEYVLTDAIIACAREYGGYFFSLPNSYYDMGNKFNTMCANIEMALKYSEYKEQLLEYIKSIQTNL